MSDELAALLATLWTAPRWGHRRGLLLPPQKAADLCRWCANPLPSKRHKWCSRVCVDRYLKLSGWPALRCRIVHRDQCCQSCRIGIDEDADFEVDHIRPIADGGNDDPSNLRLLCKDCHQSVTSAWLSSRTRHQDGDVIAGTHIATAESILEALANDEVAAAGRG